MESLAMKAFAGIYANRSVLVTGHTGFKGSWLALWLHALGARVSGLALAPEQAHSHYLQLDLPLDSHYVDLRDALATQKVVEQTQPEIVFHLAAQPLVRRAYQDPLSTWSTNVMGTAHLLEACRHCPSIKAIVCITTDKCYDNQEWVWGYRETDPLGGHDPYSASKAGVELLAASYRKAYFHQPEAPLLATARAGNVIGGGDWSEDRFIPDLVRALQAKQSLEIRSPKATRPWQHVLDCLSGYLLLGQKLIQGGAEYATAYNLGPVLEANASVEALLQKMSDFWPQLQWHLTDQNHPHEARLLYLDSAKARTLLNWHPVWDLEATLQHTASWYQHWLQTGQVISHQQLQHFITDAAQAGCEWASL